MIRNIIFDFGKVLVDYDFDFVVDTFFDDPEQLRGFKDIVCGEEFVNRCDTEEIPFEELIKEYQTTYPQWAKQFQLFYDHYLEYVLGEVPEMHELRKQLKKQGFHLYGLTNWCSMVHPVIAKYPIFGLLDGRIISSEEHIIKPNPSIYMRLCQKYSLKPEECVFIDDKAVNIDGAQKVGMQTILFQDAKQFEHELNQLISKQNESNCNPMNDNISLSTAKVETPVLNEHNKDEHAPAHTAEHLLNQTMIRMFGCERSKNAHIERKKSKINYNLPTCPKQEQITEIEQTMNELIQKDLPVTYEFVTRDNIPEGVVLDKLPKEASETLRIVRIGDYDVCACIGQHVASTREIGIFRITSTSYNEGSFRIVYKVNN